MIKKKKCTIEVEQIFYRGEILCYLINIDFLWKKNAVGSRYIELLNYFLQTENFNGFKLCALLDHETRSI